MMNIQIKPGVDLHGLSPKIWEKVWGIAAAFDALGYECIITSGRDGQHMRTSKHYTGEALDFRAHHIKAGNHRAAILAKIVGVCGKGYDVILHGEGDAIHYHVEYDPK